jgi:hypothetical protein
MKSAKGVSFYHNMLYAFSMKSALQKAIVQTIRYASFFNFELTQYETYLYLISSQTYPLPKKTSLLPPSRLKSKRISQTLIKKANQVTLFLQKFPTINLIAVTGSLAMENAKRGDDLDLMIVTQKNTLWFTRLFIVPLTRLLFKTRHPQHPRGVKQSEARLYSPGVNVSGAICLNLWLDDSALSLPKSKRNLYTAHEVLQIKPLYNRNFTYERFIQTNSWTKKHLANFYQTITQNRRHPRGVKQSGARLYSPGVNAVLSVLNLLAFTLQYLYMLPKMTRESVSLHSAYFHPRTLASKLTHYLEDNPYKMI